METVNCDGLAPWYRLLEHLAFGDRLERARARFLPLVTGADGGARVLVLGEGDGRFLAGLVAANAVRDRHVDVVDTSARMLRLARHRESRAAPAGVGPGSTQGTGPARCQVAYHQADAREWLDAWARQDPGTRAGYDLVVTHFFLDCFDAATLPALVAAIGAVARPGARWLVADFRQPAAPAWWVLAGRALLAGMYLFFRLTTGLKVRGLADHRPWLARAGFVPARVESMAGGLLATELWCQPPAGDAGAPGQIVIRRPVPSGESPAG